MAESRATRLPQNPPLARWRQQPRATPEALSSCAPTPQSPGRDPTHTPDNTAALLKTAGSGDALTACGIRRSSKGREFARKNMFPADYLRNFIALYQTLAALCIGYYSPAQRRFPTREPAAAGPAAAAPVTDPPAATRPTVPLPADGPGRTLALPRQARNRRNPHRSRNTIDWRTHET